MNRLVFLFVCVLMSAAVGRTQPTQPTLKACPDNIGFEKGDFSNWECSIGKINIDGSILVASTSPTGDRHGILKNEPPFSKDPYGNFPVNCPNGSGYSIKLGNSSAGAQAEQVTYTFTIPPNDDDFVILYNYAVVFQNPNHLEFEQPRFSTAVYDQETGKKIDCASFEFAASSSLPGFQKSNIGGDVFYKTWSPVTIKLYGYAGKTIRLEFTTNDCTKGGHFGYAYVDVNENCSSLISGNVFCNGDKDLTLTSPAGFMEYHWFDKNFTQELGNTNTLSFQPPPAPGTTYALQIVPFPGLGCLDTLYTTIEYSADGFTFKTIPFASACAKLGLDLTVDSITKGSTPGLTFSYFMDPNQNELVPQPKYVQQPGSYYIKAVNAAGCDEMKSVAVEIKPSPDIKITPPPSACYPNTVDITNPSIVQGNNAGYTYSYWKLNDGTEPITQPTAVDKTDVYYIKAVDTYGCNDIKPVSVLIADYETKQIEVCESADLTLNNFVLTSNETFNYSYWTDPNATNPISSPDKITQSNTYYVKGTTSSGCSIIRPVVVKVLPIPVVTFTNPATVMYPKTVDLTKSIQGTAGLNYGYWHNKSFTDDVENPTRIDSSGTYYITVSNASCQVNFTATVKIDPPPLPTIIAPNVFSPNGDGINDLFSFEIDGVVEISQFRIYNRWSELVFSTRDINNLWNGKVDGKPLTTGTYYWVLEGSDIYRRQKFVRTGNVTIIR
jgi:gliding motility-associated-like protein